MIVWYHCETKTDICNVVLCSQCILFNPPNLQTFLTSHFSNTTVLTSFNFYFKTFLFWPAAIQTYGFPQEMLKTYKILHLSQITLPMENVLNLKKLHWYHLPLYRYYLLDVLYPLQNLYQHTNCSIRLIRCSVDSTLYPTEDSQVFPPFPFQVHPIKF